MYLTAQRVRSARDKIGINAFLYRHGNQVVPGMSWDHPVLARVADEHIGARQAESVEVAPGGNHVMSYIDVVTADDTPADEIQAALDEFGVQFRPEDLPEARDIGRVAVRFGAQFGLAERARDEFREIAARAIGLLRNPLEPAWRAAEPLAVDVTLGADQMTFALRASAIDRLRAIHGPDWAAPRISVTNENRDDFEAVHGDVYRNFVPVLTGLDLERVAELGGVRFYNATNGTVLRVWPAR